MSRRVSPLAGFQVTIIGRFWVTTEGSGTFHSPDGFSEDAPPSEPYAVKRRVCVLCVNPAICAVLRDVRYGVSISYIE